MYLSNGMKYFLTILFLLFFHIQYSNATHIIGGEISYRCLGGGSYEITMKVYRDCYNGVPDLDDPAVLGVFDKDGTLVLSFQMTTPLMDTLGAYLPCLTIPPDICVERGIYKQVIQLPNTAGGFDIAYQRCCRNNTINNIVDPDATGATYTAHIPDASLAGCNNNPFFNNFPPIFICKDSLLVFDHSATDIDGDVLVYELCTPFNGADTWNPRPDPPAAPPYPFVLWLSPYSTNDPLGGTPLTINSSTGLLTGIPNKLGQFVVGVCVKEFRNGNLLSETKRDFQFNVADCPPTPSASFDVQLDTCNLSIQLNNTSVNAANYFWDFGDLISSSTSLNPMYTYLRKGTYSISLIATSSAVCADTFIREINLPSNVKANAGEDKIICKPESGQLETYFRSEYIYTWSPATYLNDSTIYNPVCTPDSDRVYFLTVSDNFCTARDTVAVKVPGIQPTASIDAQVQYFCEYSTIQFFNKSINADSYFWNFGDGNSSTEANPVVNINNQGNIYVTFVAINNGYCTDTSTISFSSLTEFVKGKNNFPNVFTPNNDGSNDCFRPLHYYTNGFDFNGCYEFMVFNRWGEKIFYSQDYLECWNGNKLNGGKQLAEEVYFFLVKINEQLMDGWVTIIR